MPGQSSSSMGAGVDLLDLLVELSPDALDDLARSLDLRLGYVHGRDAPPVTRAMDLLGLARVAGIGEETIVSRALAPGLLKQITVLTAADVDAYCEQFVDLYSCNLHPLVATRLETSDGPLDPIGLTDSVPELPSLQLVGRSGAGKTHLAKHLAVSFARQKHFPLFLHAESVDARAEHRGGVFR